MKEEPFEEYLKRVIPATKEEREAMERLRNMPPPTPEEVERQLRASGAWRGRVPAEKQDDSKNNPNKQRGS